MASLVGFGDVVKIIELAEWIIRNCFDSTNSANVRYGEFKNVVENLKNSMPHLKSELEKALHQVQPTNLHSIKKEVDRIVGDFNATLNECEALLKKFRKFERGKDAKATVSDNLRWNKSTQE